MRLVEDPGVQVRKTRLGWEARVFVHEIFGDSVSYSLFPRTFWGIKRESACAAARKFKAKREEKIANLNKNWEPC